MENNAAEIILAERGNEKRKSAPELHHLAEAVLYYRKTEHARTPFREGRRLEAVSDLCFLGTAVLAGAFSLVLVIASFTKTAFLSTELMHTLMLILGQVRRMTKIGNISTIVVSSLCLILSWTCSHRDYEYKNVDFHEICTEMRFAFWAGVGLAGLEAVNLGIFVIWWLMTRRSRGYSKV
ncbi:hypothetical protein EJ07DRAFT_162394 [Lizonia empirigonia]|nr:hypothetical protein EJ07DRAFT_162394 [Lizonia empirigonia]